MAWGGRQRAMETAQHRARLPKNQPAEITMFQISEVQETHAFNGRRSFLATRACVRLQIILNEQDRDIAGWCVCAAGWESRQRVVETAQHRARLAKNQPAEIAMLQISEVQEAPAFNGRRSFLTLRAARSEPVSVVTRTVIFCIRPTGLPRHLAYRPRTTPGRLRVTAHNSGAIGLAPALNLRSESNPRRASRSRASRSRTCSRRPSSG